LNSLTKKEGS